MFAALLTSRTIPPLQESQTQLITTLESLRTNLLLLKRYAANVSCHKQTNKITLGCSLHHLRCNAHVHVLGLPGHAFSLALFLFLLSCTANDTVQMTVQITPHYWHCSTIVSWRSGHCYRVGVGVSCMTTLQLTILQLHRAQIYRNGHGLSAVLICSHLMLTTHSVHGKDSCDRCQRLADGCCVLASCMVTDH